MSILDRFSDKPWAQPIRYTSDADPSHNAGNEPSRGISRTSEYADGQVIQTGGRDHYQPSEFGDGRPDPSMVDQSPMVYRGPNPGAVIDIDDKDELDGAMSEYVPPQSTGSQVRSQHMTPAPPIAVEEFANLPYRHPGQPKTIEPAPTHLESGNNRLTFDMLGVLPVHGGVGGIVANIGSSAPPFVASADELEHAAVMFQAWAKMLRAIQR